MHIRQQIREAIQTELKKDASIKLVAIGRRHRLNELRQIPAAIIYTDAESQEQITARPRRFLHTVQVLVAYYVKPTGATLGENKLDTLAQTADPLIIAALEALAEVKRAIPTEWDLQGNGETDGDYLMGERMFLVEYETQEPA